MFATLYRKIIIAEITMIKISHPRKPEWPLQAQQKLKNISEVQKSISQMFSL